MATADERIGANLRRFRERDGQSQAELARRMSAAGHPWQQSTVARTEGGQQPLRAGELETLAKMFRVAVERFFSHAGEAVEQDLVQGALDRLRDSTVDAVEAVAQFNAARSEGRRAARDAARSGYPRVREAAKSLSEELLNARLENVLIAAEARLEELRAELDPAHAGRPKARHGGGSLEGGGFLFKAMRAAVALYGQAELTAVTPQVLAYVTDGLTRDVVDVVIAAVAEVAREEQNGAVLRRIRQIGLEQLAAEGLAAEVRRRTVDDVPIQDLSEFMGVVSAAWRGQVGWESAKQDVLDYVGRGGTSQLAAAELLVAKMPADSLPAFIPLRERGLAELAPTRDEGIRRTRPQATLPPAGAVPSLDDLPSAADLAATAIMGQEHKPIEQREQELAELLRALHDTGNAGEAS